jgi:hypothetical protein
VAEASLLPARVPLDFQQHPPPPNTHTHRHPLACAGRRLQDWRRGGHAGEHHRLQAVPPRQRGLCQQERRHVQRNVQRPRPRHRRPVRG